MSIRSGGPDFSMAQTELTEKQQKGGGGCAFNGLRLLEKGKAQHVLTTIVRVSTELFIWEN